MGSDYHLNPPPPPPLWKQVQNLMEQSKDKSETITEQREEIKRLKEYIETQDRTIARLTVQLEGHEFNDG